MPPHQEARCCRGHGGKEDRHPLTPSPDLVGALERCSMKARYSDDL